MFGIGVVNGIIEDGEGEFVIDIGYSEGEFWEVCEGVGEREGIVDLYGGGG